MKFFIIDNLDGQWISARKNKHLRFCKGLIDEARDFKTFSNAVRFCRRLDLHNVTIVEIAEIDIIY